jgi:acetoin utilization deacetylase AcuC-like enzyme
MRVSYIPDYFVELPPQHPFPMGKFPALHQILLAEGLLQNQEVVEPREAAWEDLRLVHTAEYLGRLEGGLLDRAAERKMGLPWSATLVRRSRLAVQGTLNAAVLALEDGIAANLAGGTHHAFAGHGEGFCVLNDVAVAIRVLGYQGKIKRALVVDLDVHQGNGTAAIFAADDRTYTFSVHGEKNYPFQKMSSSRDVGLPNHIGDAAYLEALEAHLPEVLEAAQPDLVFYLAGVDPVEGDRYGRLDLSREGLHLRDRLVLERVRDEGVPLVLLMSGGYAPTPRATADLHAVAHREAQHVFA